MQFTHVDAQEMNEKPARILFLLDASSSMQYDWNEGKTRFQIASDIINAIVDSIHQVNKDVAFAVRVFGGQYPAQMKNCFDTKLEVSFNYANDEQIKTRLKYIKPLGYSPIALSLKETAENDFVRSHNYAYSIILVTDGGESCGGDICKTAQELLDKKISFKPYILSLVNDPSLVNEYSCLGKYLNITQPSEVQTAIKTIINDNRKVLMVKAQERHRTTLINTPQPIAANPVVEKPVIKTETPPPTTPTLVPAAPIRPTEKALARIWSKNTTQPKAQKPTILLGKTIAVKPLNNIRFPDNNVAVTPPATPVIVAPQRIVVKKMDRIYSNTKLKPLNLLYTIPYGELTKVAPLGNIALLTADDKMRMPPPTPTKNPVTASTQMNIIEPSTTRVNNSTGPKVARKDKKTDDILSYTNTAEDAKASTLQLYFTDGKGKFYLNEPKMNIKKSSDGSIVKSVHRNLNGGQPVPIALEPGTYDIEIPGSKSKAQGIVIEPSKNNKYYINITKGSLGFAYAGSDKAVIGYKALVSNRFEKRTVVTTQASEEELPYEPASYHVELNTLPQLVFFIDLDFNVTRIIPIPEMGTIHITNANNKGKVQFWHQKGDRYVPFYELMVNGKPDTQKEKFLPGLYQLRYYKNATDTNAEILLFRIKSNTVTSIELP
jgi:hypothetical protein